MSDIELLVSLKYGHLDVDDEGFKVLPHGQQSIAWVLDEKTLKGCKFEPVGAADGGFCWVQAPPSKVFSTPWVSADGTRLTIEDTHRGDASHGHWIYLLRVRKSKSVVYETTHVGVVKYKKGGKRRRGPCGTSRMRTVNNPAIINH